MQKIGVVILNYQKYDLTINCVRKLSTYEDLRIIIVDNNSCNESYEILDKQFGSQINIAVLKTNVNGGYSYGNNFGIHHIEKFYPDINYICIMNPDIELNDFSVFEKFIDILDNNNDIGLITSFQILNNNFGGAYKGYWKLPIGLKAIFDLSYISRLFKTNDEYNVIQYKDNNLLEVDATVGSFFMMKLDILKSINYLDENVFLYYEENILRKKLLDKDLKEVILMDSFYHHNHEHNDTYKQTLKKMINNQHITLRSKNYYLKSYVCNSKIVIALSTLIYAIDCIIMITCWIFKRMRRILR